MYSPGMEPRTHRITLTIGPKGLDPLIPRPESPTWNTWATSQLRLDFEAAMDAFKRQHPSAQVPEGRMPELIAFDENLKVIGEASTYRPEDWNSRVMGAEPDLCSWLIQRGVDVATANEVKKDPAYPEHRFLKLQAVRDRVRRVDIQFCYEET